MNSPVRAQYNFCYEVLKEGVKLHRRHGMKLSRFVPQVGTILIVLSLISAFFGQGVFLAVLPWGFVGVLLLAIGPLILWNFRRQFRLNPNKNVEIIWTFTDENLGSQGEGFLNNMAWRKVFRFVDTDRGFLIYPQKSLFFWIPFAGFQGPSDIEAVRGFAKSRVLKYERIG
jgi:YcxB-like protein